jgi:hypothetical protein
MGASIFVNAAVIRAYTHSEVTWQWWEMPKGFPVVVNNSIKVFLL